MAAEIGIGLTGFGVLFSFLGIIFFFDKGLLAMGNGSISFLVGFCLVLLGWAILGMIVEAYGFIVLFSGFWPTVVVFLGRIPVLGWLINTPFLLAVDTATNMILSSQRVEDNVQFKRGVQWLVWFAYSRDKAPASSRFGEHARLSPRLGDNARKDMPM
ncbi:hypothetical protein AXG93_3040s1030 [Marchantia polymorpha subsp. ruderalis]|uniref:Uncharacterized protein n=1 Tax=Marchantia polymorpha subsp. ruderalis TaxID=1480154 RepID=A0A176W247_MARPO|nr:hypothetical protein AXG93_3040s1030 [Marchantia polymorpha subsp. ruderalis]